MKAQRGADVQSYSFFNFEARQGSQSQAPTALPPGKRHDTPCTGSWVRARAGLNECRKSSTWIQSQDHPVRSQLLYSLRSRLKYITIGSCNEQETMLECLVTAVCFFTKDADKHVLGSIYSFLYLLIVPETVCKIRCVSVRKQEKRTLLIVKVTER